MAAAMPVMAGLSVVGAGLQAAGELQHADAQMKAADVSAAGDREQARIDQAAGYEQGLQVRTEGQRILGAQTAAYASSGVTVGTGSALLVAAQQATNTERDALKAEYAGLQGASVLRRQADLTLMGAQQVRRESQYAVAGTLLGGGSRALLYGTYPSGAGINPIYSTAGDN